MATAADVNNAMDQACSALLAGNHAEAIRHALIAQAKLIGIPDHVHSGDELTWDREGITRWMEDVRRHQSATQSANGIRRSKIRYAPTSEY